MAIQIPNPGTGNGATGDNEFVLWTKVKDNFSDQTNAASRLVGIATGQVPLAEQVQKLNGAFLDVNSASGGAGYDLNTFTGGHYAYVGGAANSPAGYVAGNPFFVRTINTRGAAGGYFLQEAYNRNTAERQSRAKGDGAVWSAWAKDYTTANTTKEPTTGYLKAASPILHLFNDDLVKEHEAVEQDITVEKLGTGDYLIKGSTGLSNEGWNLSPPKDIHGNVLCMVEATEADGNINVKTYKRKFDFDIVAIVPDYDQPFDIPDGHSVDLRLNDLPQETQMEV